MNPRFRHILIRVLTNKLRKFPKAGDAPIPDGGWLRAIRQATGMPVSHAAKRAELSRQSFNQLEKSEAAGTITLQSLRRAADAIDCDLVYALTPRGGSLGEIIKKQALLRASRMILPVAHSMDLESQASTPGPKIRELAKQLASKSNRTLWSE